MNTNGTKNYFPSLVHFLEEEPTNLKHFGTITVIIENYNNKMTINYIKEVIKDKTEEQLNKIILPYIKKYLDKGERVLKIEDKKSYNYFKKKEIKVPNNLGFYLIGEKSFELTPINELIYNINIYIPKRIKNGKKNN